MRQITPPSNVEEATMHIQELLTEARAIFLRVKTLGEEWDLSFFFGEEYITPSTRCWSLEGDAQFDIEAWEPSDMEC
jgi:hypothetical protein